MALLPANLDYTDKDFDSIRLRLQALIRSVFPKWTDFNVANFGNILLDLFAFNGDVLGLYQDNQALEAFIAKATQRKNLIALGKLIGYVAPTAKAATATVLITASAVPVGSITIAAGRTARTAEVTDPIVFQLLADAVIGAAQDPPQVTTVVENSSSADDSFESTGLGNQEIVLGSTPYLDDSAVITAGNGVYTQVEDFLDSTSSDRHFTVVVDQNDRATVRFGNGVNGAIPFGTITVEYKTGGGAAGNVEAGAIVKLDGVFTDSLGTPVTLSITNAVKSDNGAERASVEKIRQDAPRSLRVQNRTVSREDYEINALRVPGVARALMVTSNEDTAVQENTGNLYIVPEGGGAPSQALKDAVHVMVTETYPNTLTFTVYELDPDYLDFDFTMTVFGRSGYTKAQIGATIRAALASFFAVSNDDGTANEEIDFGFAYKNQEGNPDGVIPLDQLFDVVRDLPQVRRMGDDAADFLINGEHQDVEVAVRQFPRLGTVIITDGDTGLLL